VVALSIRENVENRKQCAWLALPCADTVDLSSHGFIGSESSPSQTSGQFACVRKVGALTDCLFSYGTSLVIQSTDIPSLRSFTVAESECTISCWRMD